MAVQIAYGYEAGNLKYLTPKMNITSQQMQVINLENLEGGKRYYYQLYYVREGQTQLQKSKLSFFQTQRKVNQAFSFSIQADSHLDENTDPATYLQTVKNMATDSVDFLVDLGDTWMTDKYREDYKLSAKQYEAQRYYFSEVAYQAALFNVLGNHDGESKAKGKKGDGSNMQVWSNQMRSSLYINPVKNQFYSGNSSSYYACNGGMLCILCLILLLIQQMDVILGSVH
jgi:predicted MPP superfamily phosphohydrolase